MELILDLGAHRGQDLPYYLRKAKKVVAVEANPVLCNHLRSTFREELRDKRLYLEEGAVVAQQHSGPITF